MAVIGFGFADPVVYISSGGAEHVVEKLSGVDKELIEKHQDLAKIALIGAIVFALIGIVQFIRPLDR